MARKTPTQMLELHVRNAMGNARYYRSLGDPEACRKLVQAARTANRELRDFLRRES